MTADGSLDRVVDEFAAEVPGVRHAVVVSSDGLRLAASRGVGEPLDDQLAAATAGLTGLGRGTAHLLGSGPVAQVIVEFRDGYLFVTTVQEGGSTLAVHADHGCDMGTIAREMALLASRVGHVLARPRASAAGGARR